MSLAPEIALLARLLETGEVHEGQKIKNLISRYSTARWIIPGKRRATWALREEERTAVQTRLELLLPSWQQDFVLLRSKNLDPFKAVAIEALAMLRREVSPKTMINRRNWNASSGAGPKHTAQIQANVVLTSDWVMRFRPNKGLVSITEGGKIDLWDTAAIWTECSYPERAWMRLTQLAGVFPRLIITCENLGPYIDLPVADSTLVLYSPGQNTQTAVVLLKALPEVPWMHFGDMDPKGVEIATRIAAESGRLLSLFIPSFAEEYLDVAKPVKTPWGGIPDNPTLISLKKMNKGIFQEVFMLDERLSDEIRHIHRQRS
ncbi:MAG: DUF2220 family protein [Alphaproteobacteria bacterium]|nr:DUF2220 family protein [Alphaproteobacteria bacterium]